MIAAAVTDATSPSPPTSSSSPSSLSAAVGHLVYNHTAAAVTTSQSSSSSSSSGAGLWPVPSGTGSAGEPVPLPLLLGGALVAVLCTSLFANLLLLGVFYRRPALLFHIANRFVLNLIVADVLQTAVVMPLSLAPLLGAVRPPASYCRAAVTLAHVLAFAGVNTVAVVAVDRYLAIIHPLSYPSKMTPRRASNLIACTWGLGALQGGPPLVGWGAAGHDAATGLCAPLWEAHASYAAYVSVATFWLPVTVMLACYLMVFRAARRQNMLVRPLRRWGSGAGEPAAGEQAGGPPGLAKDRRRFRQHWKAARVVFLILASNVLCTGPYSLLGAAGRPPCWLRAGATLLFFCQCCVHPYIYGYMHRSIREEMLRALCGGLAGPAGGPGGNARGPAAAAGGGRTPARPPRRRRRRRGRAAGGSRAMAAWSRAGPSTADSGALPPASSAGDSALPSSVTDSGALTCGGALHGTPPPPQPPPGSGCEADAALPFSNCIVERPPLGGVTDCALLPFGAPDGALPFGTSGSVADSAQRFSATDSARFFSTVESALPFSGALPLSSR